MKDFFIYHNEEILFKLYMRIMSPGQLAHYRTEEKFQFVKAYCLIKILLDAT